MSDAARREVLRNREQAGLPWHGPPHPGKDCRLYIISAACYNHAEILGTPHRLTEFEFSLLDALEKDDLAEVRAWVILPNHYHLLLKTELPKLKNALHR